MARTVAVIAPGAMGSAVGRRLAEHGVRVLTSVAGRSARSVARARDCGMEAVCDRTIAGEAEIILSIVPPAEAVALARRLAGPLAEVARGPVYVDCNAVDVGTVRAVAAALAGTGAAFVDGAIIGLPPEPGAPGPVLYLAGEAAPRVAGLAEAGLRVKLVAGPVGAASALKMSYAGITKGLTALAAAMVLAAERAGAGAALREELAASQPGLLARFDAALPDMVPKAYRWVAEMREIAAFVGPGHPEAAIYEGAAALYARLAADHEGARAEIGVLDAFRARGTGD